MGADNYENLGFQVKIDGATDAVKHLDDIIDRLKQIQTLNRNGSNKNGKGGKIGGFATSGQIIGDDLAKAQAKGQQDNYNLALKYARKLAQISDPAYKKVYDMGLQVKAYKKKIETSNYLSASANEEANKSTETNTTVQNKNTKAVNKNKTAIKNKVNAQKQEEKQTKINTKGLTSYIGKLTSTIAVARKLGHFVSTTVKETAAYTENLVLFSVAFGKTTDEQLKWALGLVDSYGLARNEVVKFAGTFRELASSLGLVGEMADTVTKTVTMLGYDLSALYNTSVSQAMERLQSGVFTGQTKPLRYFGVDISQNQIDTLLESNKALASLGVSAKDLSQSQKVLARLLITMQSATDSFGTMAREINNLQSQFRIFQGSISNFKIAIGEFVEEPLRRFLVYSNGFIIAMTNIVNSMASSKESKKNKFEDVTNGAEDAEHAIEQLNGKLATFDKFNVLGGQSSNNSNIAVTEQLNKLLEEQAEIYEKEVETAMEEVANEATLMAEKLTSFFIVLDENGKFKGFTDNAKRLAVVLAGIAAIALVNPLRDSFALISLAKEFKLPLADAATQLGGVSSIVSKLAPILQFLISPLGIILTTIGILYATNERFRDSVNNLVKAFIPLVNVVLDFGVDILSPIIPLLTGIINLLSYPLAFAIDVTTEGVKFLYAPIALLAFALEAVAKAGATVIQVLSDIANLNFSNMGSNISKIWSTWSSSELLKQADLSAWGNISGFADGGYTNANLIMTHENGKREWVGKAAGSSAIVNDTQMSDIMEVAVAKGVYQANMASKEFGSGGENVIHNHIYMDGKQIFEGVTQTAKQRGFKWAR